jgi:hydrogenase maturation protein HypF
MIHNGVCIRVYGKVQGVGFRPFVWQLAQQLNLTGDVCNDAQGVEVRLWGDERRFLPLLYQQCPPLAYRRYAGYAVSVATGTAQFYHPRERGAR